MFKNFNTKLFEHQYRSGIPPEKIASFYNLDEALVWAILLEGKDDLERFKLFGKNECYQSPRATGPARIGLQSLDYGKVQAKPMIWTREHPPTPCSKCGKTVLPGRKLGQEGRLSYCHKCGLSRELVFAHRIDRQLTMPHF